MITSEQHLRSCMYQYIFYLLTRVKVNKFSMVIGTGHGELFNCKIRLDEDKLLRSSFRGATDGQVV